MNKEKIESYQQEIVHHLKNELLPFWLKRCRDNTYGGFITHFDADGNDTGEDQKSLIAQTRTVFSMSTAHRHGWGHGQCADLTRHGLSFLLDAMWDNKHGGFLWTVDRKGEPQITKKILYGHSFGIYALSEYTNATGDARGREYAERLFDLVQKYCTDTLYGGYFEMHEQNWDLCGPGAAGGDRKTLDVHMHLMEAFTRLYECTGENVHRQKLQQIIDILLKRILHPETRTGIPQFWRDWQVAPQIKFDIVWGWDRFTEDGAKTHAEDNTSYGHNCEFAWLLSHALDVLGTDKQPYLDVIRKQLDHAVSFGIDHQNGGVYVEGSHTGQVYDREKEFWQHAEVMIGMLEGCLLFDPEKYWPVYENVHRFVFDKMIHHEVGEWWPLLRRDGTPIWTHMSHSWKVNYHTIRCMVECKKRLDKLAEQV